MNGQSAVAFPGQRRIHIALATSDLGRSKAFYQTLLGVPPTKERPGYVKFEPEDPSVNLTLNQVEDTASMGKPATHFGVQVKSVQAVEEAIARLAAAGLPTRTEEQTTCCYAVQDKVWATDPDGNAWEVFVVLEADAPGPANGTTACCTPGHAASAPPQAEACCGPGQVCAPAPVPTVGD